MKPATSRHRRARTWHGRLRAWTYALGAALGAHVALLGLGFAIFRAAAGETRSTPVSSLSGDTLPQDTPSDWADLEMSPAVEVRAEIAEAPPPIVPPHPIGNGDATQMAEHPAAGTEMAKQPQRPPAPDEGEGTGRTLDSPSWRRDRSTLRARLSDGAQVYQPPHEQTSARTPSSPQEIRRELKTGMGDARRTDTAQQPAPVPSLVAPPTMAEGLGGQPKDAPAAPNTDTPIDADIHHRIGERPSTTTSVGALDVRAGTRQFDVDLRKASASDDVNARAASGEAKPGIVDLALASVSGKSDQGRGPSDTPGATRAASTGTAASRSAATGLMNATGDEDSQRERTYNRYNREIQNRIQSRLVFPKDLALRMEQGETVLRFVLRPDGTLAEATRIIKSSGFDGFDQAALNAVKQSLPFPPFTGPRPAPTRVLSMPVTFSNPVIR